MSQAPWAALSGGTGGVLSRAKFWLCSRLPPKAYWYIMGRLKPVQAVTSAYGDIQASMASGREVVDLLAKLGVLDASDVTLQIGSGLGRVERHLAERVTKCVGLDVSASMVRRAKDLVVAENVQFVHTDGTGLDLWPDETFDLVYSFFVFQHLPRPQYLRYLRDAQAKLRPAGHLVFQLMIDESGERSEPPASHPYGLRHYCRADVERQLQDVGLVVTARTDLNGDPDDVSTPTADVVFCARKPA